MFVQICLLTAAWHWGRKRVARNQAARLTAVEHVDDTPSDAARRADEAAVHEQMQIATASVAITGVAAVALPQLRLLGGVSVMIGSIPIFARAWQRLRDERRVGIEVLDSAALVASVAARQYVVSALTSLVYVASQKLRLRTERASQQSMRAVFARRPDHAWLRVGDVEVRVPAASLRPGDVIVVTAGHPIPIDGRVLAGTALVDQQLLTGESQPAEKFTDDPVLATTLVLSGRLDILVETTGEGSAAAELERILQNTAAFSSGIELESRKLADASAVPILALSALAFPLTGALGTVAMLNIGIADNMRVAAPLSMLNYLRRAYDAGILLKDGRSLQRLREVDTVVFDKTGTLTQDRLQVRRLFTVARVSEAKLLAWAAAAEHRQTHPIARAIVAEAAARKLPVPAADDPHISLGFGLRAQIAGHTALVGSERFMAAEGLKIPKKLAASAADIRARGCSWVYVARDEHVIGLVELEPTLRPEVDAVVRALRQRNLKLVLLSGDHEGPSRALAERLGFDDCFAGVLPQGKTRHIEQLQAQGRVVCFVGDGLNDAIALKRADVSVSVSGAASLAMDCAQITFLGPGLERLPALFDLADAFHRDMRAILLTAAVPAGYAAAGVLFAGFTTNVVSALYIASMAAGLAIAGWPLQPDPLAAPRD